MDTVIRNIMLRGKTVEQAVSDVEDWINDASNKLNILLNNDPWDRSEMYNLTSLTGESESPADHVIDRGETQEGTCAGTIVGDSRCFYRKWKSGTLEIWGYRKSNNIVFQSCPWGGWESRVDTRNGLLTRVGVWGTWVIPFVDIPSVDYRIATTDTAEYAGDYKIIHSERFGGVADKELIKTQSPEFKIWRGDEIQPSLLHNPTITFRAIGRWK